MELADNERQPGVNPQTTQTMNASVSQLDADWGVMLAGSG